MMNKTIATYYEPVDEINSENELKLIELWKNNWESYGFKTIILSENDAKNNSIYSKYENKISLFPTTNPTKYERASWMRWLAISSLEEPVFMADYDCFIYKDFNPIIDVNKLNLFCNHVPCLTYGEPYRYGKICQEIIKYELRKEDIYNNIPHISDMLWLLEYIKGNSNILVHDKCIFEYNEIGWENSVIVHYPNARMADKKPKYLYIPLLRKLRN